MENLKNNVDKIVSWYVHIIMLILLTIVLIATFNTNTGGEASIGSFETYDFNKDWTIKYNDTLTSADLPYSANASPGDTITATNTLPETITDGMSLIIRASMQDLYIYI